MSWANRLVQLRDSFWFVPALMAGLSVLAAVLTTRLDSYLDRGVLTGLEWAWVGSAEGARSVLSVIGGTAMTVGGVVFSITVTALAQTSAHFGPRVLRNFTADRGNQIVLGTFTATFLYCLLVLRTVQADGESFERSVPFLSVNVGIGLAIASIAVLIYFIHHIVRSLQVEVLLAGIGREFRAGVDALFPQDLGQPALPDEPGPTLIPAEKEAERVCATETGYVQQFEQRRLMQLAVEHDIVVRLLKRPGDFVAVGEPIMQLRDSGAADALRRQLQQCISIGDFRTPDADASYSLQQLLEVAARALSPGVNELFTALSSIDWLTSGLERAASRDAPSKIRADSDGRPRIVASPLSFADLLSAAIDTLRPYAATQPAVAQRLTQVVERLAGVVRRTADFDLLEVHLKAIGSETNRLPNAIDRAAATQQIKAVDGTLLAARQRLRRS